MKKKLKIVCIIGTRPEAIKMAPVILELKNKYWAEVIIVATAQHRDLMDQVLSIFGIVPDIDLNIMLPNQSLCTLTSRLLEKLEKVYLDLRPDVVLAQGDTTTVMAASLACFYHKIKFGHIEAGLRTGSILNPFPEEANRVIASIFAEWHFCPTDISKNNLLNEGVDSSKTIVTGNTVIDALMIASTKKSNASFEINDDKKLILVTAHRRENFGEPLLNICDAIRSLAINNPGVNILFPVHPNPNIKTIAYDFLDGLSNVTLCDPMEYIEFVHAMKKSYFIISDSGGVQEEAPALGKPVLVLRDETERPEAVAMGVVKLIGTSKNNIIFEAQNLLDKQDQYMIMARGVTPYGDGNAAKRIIATLEKDFQI